MTYQEIIKAFLHHCQYEYGVELSKYDPTTGDIIDVGAMIVLNTIRSRNSEYV